MELREYANTFSKSENDSLLMLVEVVVYINSLLHELQNSNLRESIDRQDRKHFYTSKYKNKDIHDYFQKIGFNLVRVQGRFSKAFNDDKRSISWVRSARRILVGQPSDVILPVGGKNLRLDYGDSILSRLVELKNYLIEHNLLDVFQVEYKNPADNFMILVSQYNEIYPIINQWAQSDGRLYEPNENKLHINFPNAKRIVYSGVV
jgi:hypothetical protein